MRFRSLFAATGLALVPWLTATAQSAGAMPTPAAKAQAVSFPQLAARCAPDINIHTLASLVRQESKLNPYAININGDKQLARQPASAAEAIATARRLLAAGDNIDVGLGQINSGNFGWLGLSLDALFKPCPNLAAAAKVLSACYQRGVSAYGPGQPALHAALSCYNTGSLRNGIKNGYVRAVLAQATLPVPELLPLAPGERLAAPVPLHAHRATETARTSKGKTGVSGRADSARMADADVFAVHSDPGAFSVEAASERSNDDNQN